MLKDIARCNEVSRVMMKYFVYEYVLNSRLQVFDAIVIRNAMPKISSVLSINGRARCCITCSVRTRD